MYLYIEWYFSWIDYIRQIQDNPNLESWDIIELNNNLRWICLWNKISFVERKYQIWSLKKWNPQIHKQLFDKKTINFIHFLVKERFTTYKKIIPLFLPKKRSKYLILLDNYKNENTFNYEFDYKKWFFYKTTKIKNWQQLFVFPDLRTLYNSFEKNILEDEKTCIVHSNMTEKQKFTNFLKIKHWQKNLILSTFSNIFQDRKNLQEIHFVDPNQRYYSSFQDPRYKIHDVLNKISEIYNSQLLIHEI